MPQPVAWSPRISSERLRRRRELGRAADVMSWPGIEAEEVRDVAVMHLRRLHVPVLEPFLQLAGAADLRSARASRGSRVHWRCRSRVDARESRAACDRVAEQIAEDLLVHRRPDRRATCRTDARFSGDSDGEVTSQRCVRILDQRVEEELRRALQHRIDAPQKVAIAGEHVVIPERAGSHAPPVGHMPDCGPSIGRRRAPQIGVVMRHPAARRRTSSRAVRAPVTDRSDTMRRQRLHRLGQVGRCAGQ